MAIEAKITAQEIASFLDITPQAIHKRINGFGLKEKKTRGSFFYFGHDTARRIISPNVRQLIIAMAVVKGGVGKTTLTEALAIRCALYGIRVLCIDVDQQANLTKGLGMENEAKECPVLIDIIENATDAAESILPVMPGLDLVPSRLDNVTLDGYLMLNRKNPAAVFNQIFGNIFKNYDLIIFDCPPTLGSTVSAAMLSSDLVIAPLNPDVYSYEGIEIMDKEIKNICKDFGTEIDWKILLNKFDSKTILSNDYLSQLLQNSKFSSRLLKSVIRSSQEFPNMKNKSKTIFNSLRKSPAKEDIDALSREIIALMQNETKKNTAKKPEELTIIQ